MAQPTTCAGTRSDGSRCTSAIVLASGYCFAHDPGRRADRAMASSRGGQGKSRLARAEKLVPSTLRPVIATLLRALEETHTGELDPKQASAMAALAGAIARLYTTGVLEERIAALEEQRA